MIRPKVSSGERERLKALEREAFKDDVMGSTNSADRIVS